MEAIRGGHRDINVEHITTCTQCKGYGTKSGQKPDQCSACGGTGLRWAPIASGFHMQSTCDECGGKGTTIRPGSKCAV
jgi:molecular chaperone DnaJ